MKQLIKLPFAKRVVGYYRGFIYYFTSVLFHVYCAYYEIILIVKHFIKKLCPSVSVMGTNTTVYYHKPKCLGDNLVLIL